MRCVYRAPTPGQCFGRSKAVIFWQLSWRPIAVSPWIAFLAYKTTPFPESKAHASMDLPILGRDARGGAIHRLSMGLRLPLQAVHRLLHNSICLFTVLDTAAKIVIIILATMERRTSGWSRENGIFHYATGGHCQSRRGHDVAIMTGVTHRGNPHLKHADAHITHKTYTNTRTLYVDH